MNNYDFILASGNEHKAQEFSEFFEKSNLSISAAVEKIEVVEDGDTYEANALLKAEAYYKKYKVPVMADDSGLNVRALPEELGIFSARFGGEGLTDAERVKLLLKKMENIEDRYAFFTCVLCFYISPSEVFFFEGRVDGTIGDEIQGKDGFGYDPAFYPEALSPKLSFAMAPEWKKDNGHRGIACTLASKFFAER